MLFKASYMLFRASYSYCLKVLLCVLNLHISFNIVITSSDDIQPSSYTNYGSITNYISSRVITRHYVLVLTYI